jgi:hypothetical protein
MGTIITSVAVNDAKKRSLMTNEPNESATKTKKLLVMSLGTERQVGTSIEAVAAKRARKRRLIIDLHC